MENQKTNSALTPILAQFKARQGTSEIDIRESVALVDFHIRIIYTLIIAFSRRPAVTPIRLSSIPGFGTMLAVVRQGAKFPEGMGTPWIRELVNNWSGEVASAIDKFKAPKYKSFKTLRDRLAHGQPLPSEQSICDDISAELLSLTEHLEKRLNEHLEKTNILVSDGRISLHKEKERTAFEVSPFWNWSIEPEGLQIYSHTSSDGIHYINPAGDIWSIRDEETLTRFIKAYIGESSSYQDELGRLVRDVITDIASYTEDYSRPSYFFGDEDDIGYIYVPWTRSTSESNQPRIDTFRIGLNSIREWRGPEQKALWLPYTDFLKSISNWEILARRVAIGLEAFTQEKASEESSRLGIGQNSPARGPSLLRKQKDALSPSDSGDDGFDLQTRIDESCQRVKPSTSVFFLIGQAGLGKTELMVSLAKERAAFIKDNPASVLPLYLFVSSSGRTLSSLEDAVNSSLNITKLLSSQSAKALCRNGLLVLLVDGFDELLGSSGYENALGSLEPWFRALGGRGVLVASARSSYYLTQYRRSLAKATDLNVDHILAELQPWSRSASETYLREMGVPPEIIGDIKDRDWKILSVPFFAKAFSAWLARADGAEQTRPSIYDIVINQYLTRESFKLTDPNIGSLLNVQELRELFAEAAELMQGSKNREIEQSDLVSCAQLVVSTHDLESSRPGLMRRLSSLCGLGVSPDASGQNQFGFSHEILFDCFLSLALQRKISGPVISKNSIIQLLSASTINPSVFEWLIEKAPHAIETITSNIQFKVSEESDSQVLSSNLGGLWEAMLAAREGIPATEIASGLQLEDINLAKTGWDKLDLSRSTISHLNFIKGITGTVEISEADITLLSHKSPDQAKRSLKGLSTAKIHKIHIGDQYGEGPAEVRGILESTQLIKSTPKEINQNLLDNVRHCLDRLARRPDVPLIIDREDLTVEDQRLSWITHIEADIWHRFVSNLVSSGVARYEPTVASGRPKVRVVFNKPVPRIQMPEEDDIEIKEFWSSI